MISFFQDGTHVIGVDYGYTPASEESETVIVGYEKAIEKDEETGEEKEVEKAITAERITQIPARGREDCIHVEYVDLPPGTRPILEQTKKGYKVTFEPIEVKEEAPPEKPTSDNETV